MNSIQEVANGAPPESTQLIRYDDGCQYSPTKSGNVTTCAAYFGLYPMGGELIAVKRSGVWGFVDQCELADYDTEQWNKEAKKMNKNFMESELGKGMIKRMRDSMEKAFSSLLGDFENRHKHDGEA